MTRNVSVAAAHIVDMPNDVIEVFAQNDPDIFREVARAFLEGSKQRPCPLCANEDPECELCGGEPKRPIQAFTSSAGGKRAEAWAAMMSALDRAVTYVELTYSEEAREEAAEAKHDLDRCRAALRLAEEAENPHG